MQQLYVIYERGAPLGAVAELSYSARVVWANTAEEASAYQEKHHPGGMVVDARIASVDDVFRMFLLQQFQLLAMASQPGVPAGFDPKGPRGGKSPLSL